MIGKLLKKEIRLVQIMAVGVVVYNSKNEILLRQRHKAPDKGKWELFGGYVIPDERLIDTVKRVLKRKLGTTKVTNIKFTGKYYDEPGRHPTASCIPLIFGAKYSGKLKEDLNLKWFKKSEIKNLDLALDNKKVITDFIKNNL